MPGFSIVVPAYNSSGVIEETIGSLLSQSFHDYEIIIVDDGSADNTQEVLSKYAEKLQILHQANQGPEVARNLGIQSPMITITYPITVGHRSHPNNSSKNAGLVTKGTLALIAYERKNVYPGGNQMRFDRRGLVGSYLFNTFRRYLGIKNIKQIAIIILKARTMLITGIVRKLLSFRYYSKSHLIEIKNEAAR